MAIAPNTATSVLNEMFFVVNVQPPNTQIFERWFASYQRIKTKGIVTGDSAYQAVVQKLSGEVERPLLGYAELIAKRRWWGGVCAHNDDSLKAKTEEFVHKMMAKYIELYP